MLSNIKLEQLELTKYMDREVLILYHNNKLKDKIGQVHIFIRNDVFEKWVIENSINIKENNITYGVDRLGLVVDYVIQNNDVDGLFIEGLAQVPLYITHNDLQPIKDFVDSFCAMYARVRNKIDDKKTGELMANKEIFFIGSFPTLEKGSIFGVVTIKLKDDNGGHEAIKVFLTADQAEKYNPEKLPITKCRLRDLACFYGDKFKYIIEPHYNYWVELSSSDII